MTAIEALCDASRRVAYALEQASKPEPWWRSCAIDSINEAKAALETAMEALECPPQS